MEAEQRKIGKYIVLENTARRLVIQANGVPLIVLGALWAVSLPIMILLAPWLGGARLLIALIIVLAAGIISLVVIRFIPRYERVTVDVEEGECQAEQSYLLSQLAKTRQVQIPLTTLTGIQCRRRVWRDKPNLEVVRWAVELIGEGEKVWRLAEGEQEEPMLELARLVSKVSGRPLIEPG